MERLRAYTGAIIGDASTAVGLASAMKSGGINYVLIQYKYASNPNLIPKCEIKPENKQKHRGIFKRANPINPPP